MFYILLVIFPITVSAQDEKAKTWENEREYLKYKKEDGYKGPTEWYGATPAEMEREDGFNGSSSNSSSRQGIQYVPQQTRRDRNRRRGFNQGGGSGTLPPDPKVAPPAPVQYDPPDLDLPDFDEFLI